MPSYDLRSFFRSVGHFSADRALTSTPKDRPEPKEDVLMLDEESVKVNATPLKVAAFVDGIQASLCVTHREHRPIYLSYTAAGALGPGARALLVEEDLRIVCSKEDEEWYIARDTEIPVSYLPVSTPPDIEKEATLTLSADRAHLERSLVLALAEKKVGILALDGALVNRPEDRNLVGIVKSTGKKYLADESPLFGLPAGYRSARFVIPAGSAGHAAERYSCYLRLVDASKSAWNFGLIRLETFDPELLDSLAAMCLRERQSRASGDARWDRHLTSVRACEDFLRARRPTIFGH